MGAHELVEAGRQHVATGRIREAMACFTRAADDPERGAEALSLLAAAYLLPGAQAPELALAHALLRARAERDTVAARDVEARAPNGGLRELVPRAGAAARAAPARATAGP